MRGISEYRLKGIIAASNGRVPESLIVSCQELQEPWMTLDEFLKSGFDGWCWINTPYDRSTAYFECGVFYWNDLRDQVYQGVTHVMPIHKPEPPK